MLRLLADENLNANIIRGVLLQRPEADFVRVQDVGLGGVDDPTILEWAAKEGRVIVTQDVNTMIGYAYERIAAQKPMAGMFVVQQADSRIGLVIETIVLAIDLSEDIKWKNRIEYLP